MKFFCSGNSYRRNALIVHREMSEKGGEVTSLLGLEVRSSSEVKMNAKVGVLKEEKVLGPTLYYLFVLL